jgi:methylase of polypeptide subunit release factors
MQVPRYVRPGTLLLMEAGAATTGTLADLADAAFGDAAIVRTHRDYGLRERIVDVRFEPTRSLSSSRD